MTNFKEIQISEIFDIIWENSKLTKTFIEDNKGTFPVFSWETKNWWAYWYINFYKHEEEVLIWTTYWDAWNLRIVNWKFNIWKNASGLRIKDEFKNKVYFQYVKYLCEIYFKLNAQWWKWELRKLPQQRVKDIFIKLPINKNWEFDLEKQKEIAWKYEKLEKLKDRIRIMKEDLENQKIEITSKWNFIEKKLEEIFDLSINTNHSKFTKTFVELNKWDIPVYSASKSEILVWYWYIKDNLDGVKYFENCLTWNIDWSVWRSFYRKWKFSLSEKVIPLVLFDDLKTNLDLFYIKYSIEVEAKKEWFWFTKKAWKWRIKDLVLKIPTNKDWDFDLEKQKEIAFKYEKIQKIQKTLLEELEYLEKVKVEI